MKLFFVFYLFVLVKKQKSALFNGKSNLIKCLSKINLECIHILKTPSDASTMRLKLICGSVALDACLTWPYSRS